MKGDQTDLSVAFSGREFLLSHFGVQYAKQINTFFPKSSFIYQECSGQDALKAVEEGSTDFYITIQRPESTCLFSKVIGAFKLVPSVGSHHPLYKRAKKGETLTVADLLKYEFVSPNAPLFVISGARQSVDGWRDDKFPRNVRWQTDRASILTSIAQSEQAIAFVPEYFALQHQLFPLSIKDLLPSTKQSVYVAIRKMDRKNWRQDALCIE